MIFSSTHLRVLLAVLCLSFLSGATVSAQDLKINLRDPTGHVVQETKLLGGTRPLVVTLKKADQQKLLLHLRALANGEMLREEDRQLTDSYLASLILNEGSAAWSLWSETSPRTLYSSQIPTLAPVTDVAITATTIAVGLAALGFAADAAISGMTSGGVGGLFDLAIADDFFQFSHDMLINEQQDIRSGKLNIGTSTDEILPRTFKNIVVIRFIELVRLRHFVERTSFHQQFKDTLLQQLELKTGRAFVALSRDLENLGSGSTHGFWGKVQMHSSLAFLLRNAIPDATTIDSCLAGLQNYLSGTATSWPDQGFVTKAQNTLTILRENYAAFIKHSDRENVNLGFTNVAFDGVHIGQTVGGLTIDMLAGTASILARLTLNESDATSAGTVINGIKWVGHAQIKAFDSLPAMVAVVEVALKDRQEFANMVSSGVYAAATNAAQFATDCATALGTRFNSLWRREKPNASETPNEP